MGDLFEKIKTAKLPYKAKDLPTSPSGKYDLPCLTSSFKNQGLNYYAPRDGATILKNVISVPSNSDVYRSYFQSQEFTVLSDAYAIKWKFDSRQLSERQYLFITSQINKVIDLQKYSYKNKLGGWNVVKNVSIELPMKFDIPDYDFMDVYVAQIELNRMAQLSDYLERTGLNDYILTKQEQEAIENIEELSWKIFSLIDLFGESTRGKRLKSEDRIPGNLPFVTAGEGDQGISAFISNDVEIFPDNTTTIDMFGSAKYRTYQYGADDHVTVVHTQNLSHQAAIFVTSAIHKATFTGEFHYGRNFYAKDADDLEIMLPEKDGKTDYQMMELLVSSIQKMVIKDVVQYTERKIKATQQIINKEREKSV